MDVSEQIKCEDHVLSSVSLFCGENKTFVSSPVEEIKFSTTFVPLYYAKHIYHALDLYLFLTLQLNHLIKKHMTKERCSNGEEMICSLIPCTHVRPVLLCCDWSMDWALGSSRWRRSKSYRRLPLSCSRSPSPALSPQNQLLCGTRQ